MGRRDYDINRRRAAVAPIAAVLAGLSLAAVAVSMWACALLGVHFR